MDDKNKNESVAEPQIINGHSKKNKLVAIVAVCVVVLVILGLAVGYEIGRLFAANTKDANISQHETTSNDGNKIVTPEEGDLASIVEKVGPSVVSIVTTASAGPRYNPAAQEEGAGTGMIVSSDGYILTNKHVISNTNTIKVILSDGTTHENVKVVGTDPLNDVAFLKIDNVSNLPKVTIGDSSSVRVGQRVVAIGNSLGQYQNTVTSGIISGIGRPVSAQDGDTVENLTDLLQTDAAINPGNSGGPLLNLSGQVIGINTAIVEDAQGIGFSIPINATKGLTKGVLAGSGVLRAYLGVNFISITADVAKFYKLSVKSGGYIHSDEGSPVMAGSPAEKAGIKNGDIITKIGGVAVGAGGSVSSLVAEYAPGEKIEITILRDGKTLTLQVTLGTYKA
jgi:serine protease Do